MRKSVAFISVCLMVICAMAFAGEGKKGNIPMNPPSKGDLKAEAPVRGFDVAVGNVLQVVQNTLDGMATTRAQRVTAESVMTLVKTAAAQYQY